MVVPYLLLGIGTALILIAAIGTVISNVYETKCHMCHRRRR